ncbi:MAG: hypothetical protein ACJ779_09445 [Chloroflexota bacterium]
MFDLSLVSIHSAERERDRVSDLRDRLILKAAAQAATAATPRAPHPSATPRTAPRARAYSR